MVLHAVSQDGRNLLNNLDKKIWDFPDSPVVKTPHSQCRGHEFDPWSENQDPTCHALQPKKKRKKGRKKKTAKKREIRVGVIPATCSS